MNNDALMSEFVAQISRHKLSDDVLLNKTQTFAQALKDVLANYAANQHVLIMDKKNILSGGEDVTLKIQALVGEKMRRLS